MTNVIGLFDYPAAQSQKARSTLPLWASAAQGFAGFRLKDCE